MPRRNPSETRRADLVTLAVKLRFGPRGRDGASQPQMTLKKIAKKKRNYGKLVSIIGTAEITKDFARL